MKKYVVGFIIRSNNYIVLIRKNRPPWQAGRLNGIGGRIEPGEEPLAAMEREAFEEANISGCHWEHFITIHYPKPVNSVVHFYVAYDDRLVKAMTDERLEAHHVDDLPGGVIVNLNWLISMALSGPRIDWPTYALSPAKALISDLHNSIEGDEDDDTNNTEKAILR